MCGCFGKSEFSRRGLQGNSREVFNSLSQPSSQGLRRGNRRRFTMIRSAILLAAGRGKRQRPYTDLTPKPLLAINGRATLDYVLMAVSKAGIERVCIVTHHL